MIVALDGPAASGKGTLGRRLAAHYGLAHLDTGLLYRAVAKTLLDAGAPPDDAARALSAARALTHADLRDDGLRSQGVGEAASIVSAMPEVRAALMDFQRQFAARPGGAVLDGRDIGTVICPHAHVKIFVTATPQVRARRRAAELRESGLKVEDAAILADILRRDERDTRRAVAPLAAAKDAVVLDTTLLDVEAVLAAAIALVEARRR
ncbi:MAG: (d)CMP kinase [Proteobacteria bacterium]|nr:(d)CMP kinase [Pseudomonadota bacterium]